MNWLILLAAACGGVALTLWAPGIWAKIPKLRRSKVAVAVDNRAQLNAALCLIADHVYSLADKVQKERGISAVIDLAPLVLTKPGATS